MESTNNIVAPLKSSIARLNMPAMQTLFTAPHKIFNLNLFLRYFNRLLVCFAFAFVSACSSSPVNQGGESYYRAQMQEVYREWQGTPYRLGGTNKRGIDCSAFTQIAMYDVYRLDLPRTTSQLVNKGKKVSRSNASYGDLVFFKTGSRTRHVGIYIGNNQFMHASTSKGVIISSLSNSYWKSKFWQIRRVI